MPTTQIVGEEEVLLRDWEGVDLTANARINSPGSWRSLKNFWSPEPGAIEQRPGSTVFCKKWVIGGVDDFSWASVPDASGTPYTAFTNSQVAVNPTLISSVTDVISQGITTTAVPSGNLQVPGVRFNNLVRAVSGTNFETVTAGTTLFDRSL